MRGAEVAPKRPGERRVLAIGDSFTFGHGVGDDEAYPAVLAARLRARHGDVTVLNGGVPGYSTDQAYAFFVRHGAALDADLLLAGIHCSDVSDNYESSLYDLEDGRLVPRDARRSHLYRLGSVLGELPAVLQRSRLFDVAIASVDWQDAASARPAVADLDAWSRAKIVAEIRDLHARGIAGAMRTAAILMPCKKALAEHGADGFGSLAADLAAAGVPVLEATSAMQRVQADLTALFFREDVHLNVAGNRVLAEVIADFVTTRGLLR
jgi:lysophospholipase L1-like esterase